MKPRPYTILFTLAVTAAFVTPVSLAYVLTKSIVALNEEAFLQRAVLQAAGIEVPPGSGEVSSLYAARVQPTQGKDGSTAYYRISDEKGAPVGYVLLRSGPGLWGEIVAAVGFEADLERLTGVDFLKQSETPGLGARIAEKWFREQFRGKRGPLSTVAEGEPTRDNQFDAITGATITSTAVKAILNDTVSRVRDLVR